VGEGSDAGVDGGASWSIHALPAASAEDPGFGFPAPHALPNYLRMLIYILLFIYICMYY